MQKTINPVTRLWNLVREEKADITAIYFFAIIGSLIQLSVPLGIQAILGFVLAGTLSASLVVLISILVIGVLLTGIMQLNQMKIIEKIQQKLFVKYAFAFANRIPQLDLRQVDTFYLPELVNRFFDVTALQKNMAKLLLDLPIAMVQILFGLLVLSFYHPFFILFGLLLLLLLLLILYTTGSKGLNSSLEESGHKYSIVGWFEEMARLVKSFKFASATRLHIAKADERTVSYLQARTRHFMVLLLQYRTLIAFKVTITGAMLIVGVVLLLRQQINIGQFVAAELIIIMVISAIEKLIINLDSVYDVLTAVEKVSKLTDKPTEPTGMHLYQAKHGAHLQVKDLQFAYESAKPVLSDISFEVRPNEKVSVTGHDGAGKSTLLNLLLGVYHNYEGVILINGIPIGNYDTTSLRDRTGIYFPYENVFNGTLWENLTMGRAGIDEQYVYSLVQQTGLQSFVSMLPLGYQTPLDPTGKRLPRNVIQKILLIRALAHQPRLLIMEEPWQGLEEPYKEQIRQLLLDLPNTTVVVATNDDTFIQRCSQQITLFA